MNKILLILFLLGCLSGYSQDGEKAKSILDQVSKKTREYSSITSDFEFIMENKEVDLKEQNTGSLIIQGNKYKLFISGVEIYNDGINQWTYMPDAEEVNISEAGVEEDDAINPATIFTIYENGYKNTLLGEFINNSKATYKIELIPEEVKEFTKVIIEIDQNSLQIISAIMYSIDSNIYTVIIKNMITDKKYSNSEFIFNESKYPNVDIIDMR